MKRFFVEAFNSIHEVDEYVTPNGIHFKLNGVPDFEKWMKEAIYLAKNVSYVTSKAGSVHHTLSFRSIGLNDIQSFWVEEWKS